MLCIECTPYFSNTFLEPLLKYFIILLLLVFQVEPTAVNSYLYCAFCVSLLGQTSMEKLAQCFSIALVFVSVPQTDKLIQFRSGNAL